MRLLVVRNPASGVGNQQHFAGQGGDFDGPAHKSIGADDRAVFAHAGPGAFADPDGVPPTGNIAADDVAGNHFAGVGLLEIEGSLKA